MTFCVKCGRDAPTPAEGLCIDCFLDGRKLTMMPHHVDLNICTNCGEFDLNNAWVKLSKEEAVEEAGIAAMGVSKDAKVLGVGALVQSQDDSNYLVKVQVDMDVYGECVTEETSVIVRVKNTVCRRCSRKLGNYYASILQIRTGDKTLPVDLRDEVLDRVENSIAQQARTNREIFITKIEAVPGGVDVYLSSIQSGKVLCKTLSDSYSAETKEAAKLVGQTKDGQDMFRVTYLVRLPEFHVGDVVLMDKRLYLLTRVANGGGRMVDLANFKERSVKRTDMSDLKVMVKEADLDEAIVISKGTDEIQIMHPTNYSTVELKVPEDAEIGENVRIANIDGEIYYIPERTR